MPPPLSLDEAVQRRKTVSERDRFVAAVCVTRCVTVVEPETVGKRPRKACKALNISPT
jgi:hypothetical protein